MLSSRVPDDKIDVGFFSTIDPVVRNMWLAAAVVALVTWLLVRRGRTTANSIPVAIPLPPDMAALATQTRSPWPWIRFIASLFCFGGGMFLQVKSVIDHHNPIEKTAGWLLLCLFFAHSLWAGSQKNKYQAILKDLRHGSYDAAIAKAGQVLRWFPDSTMFLFIRGSALRAAGRLDEAARDFVRCLPAQGGASALRTSLAIEGLGMILLRQKRFREAEAMLEAARQADPASGSAQSALAELLLLQGREINKALQLLDEAYRLKEADPILRVLDHQWSADIFALRALAYARLSRSADAQSALDRADADLAGAKAVPDVASTLCTCGLALRQLDREPEAVAKFQAAARLDPNGYYGRWAATLAREHVLSR